MTYIYKKGVGWVPETGFRIFTFKGKQWKMTELKEYCRSFDITWRCSEDMLEMSDSDLENYANKHWWVNPYPGLRDGSRGPMASRLWLFTEV